MNRFLQGAHERIDFIDPEGSPQKNRPQTTTDPKPACIGYGNIKSTSTGRDLLIIKSRYCSLTNRKDAEKDPEAEESYSA